MSRRVKKLNQLFRADISALLQKEVRDPRLDTLLSVNEVDVSEDMRHATVYVSHLAGDEHKDEILAALNAAAGFFRTEIAKKTDIRYMPVFNFIWDDTIERGVRLNTLIDWVTQHQPED